jgi:hypothetical protein
MTAFVALAVGLFRGAEFLLDGGDVDADCVVLLEVDAEALMGRGATAAAGLMISWECWC